MPIYIKNTVIFIFILGLLHAEEIFIDTGSLSLAQITVSHKYCKQTSKEHSLCKSKKLNYIDYEDTDLPSFLKGLKNILKPVVDKYKNSDLKHSTLSDIKDFNSDISGDWYDEASITLFAKTVTTYTLATTSSGYSGGAHGYYSVHYDNYSTDTQQALRLDDLFIKDYKKELIQITQSHYKRTHELQPRQSLQDDGWFENKFLLAENIAITPEGLYFHYNSYEIKPYAAGHTTFLLPYSEIRSIINPQGPLRFTFQNNKHFHTMFYDKEQASISIDADINPDKSITLTAQMTNLSYLNKGWFSLSFPQLQSTQHIQKKEPIGFTSLHTYPKGSRVYHKKYNKAVSSHYLLVEGEDNQWKYNDSHTITLTLKVPMQQKELILDIRALLKSKTKTLPIPNDYEGIEGQQGYTNYRIFIGL